MEGGKQGESHDVNFILTPYILWEMEKGKWIWSFQFLQATLYHRRFCMGLLRNGKSLCLQDTFQQPPGRKKAHCAAFTFPCQIPCYYFRKAQLQAHNFHRFFEKCPIDYVLQTAQKRNSRINGRLTQSILVCSQNLSVTVSMWTPWL